MKFIFSKKSVQKFQLSLNSDKKKTHVQLWQYLAELFLESEIFEGNVVEKMHVP